MFGRKDKSSYSLVTFVYPLSLEKLPLNLTVGEYQIKQNCLKLCEVSHLVFACCTTYSKYVYYYYLCSLIAIEKVFNGPAQS